MLLKKNQIHQGLWSRSRQEVPGAAGQGLLPHSDRDLDGQWLGCPPEGEAGQRSWVFLHLGALRSVAGAGLPLMRARRSCGRLVLDDLSEPAPCWPVGRDQVPAWPLLDAGEILSRG